MNPITIGIAGLLAAASTGAATSTLDLHVTTGNNGVQAQMTTNIRQGLHATMNWEGGEITSHATVTLGPATITIDKVSGQPAKISVAGLSMVHSRSAVANTSSPRLVAAAAPFAAPPAAGFLDGVASFFSSVLSEVALWLQTMVPFLILGGLLIVLLPHLGRDVRNTAVRQPWERLGIGLVALIAMPAAAISLFVAGVFLGVWWLGLLILGLYAVLLALGYAFSGMVVGRAVSDQLGWGNLPIFWILLGGLAILSLLALIPYFGAFVALVAVTYGIGALALAPRTPEMATVPTPMFRRVQRRNLTTDSRPELQGASQAQAAAPGPPADPAEAKPEAPAQHQAPDGAPTPAASRPRQ